jgi:uncharacterized membrane protein HdeD (DUF308 family)
MLEAITSRWWVFLIRGIAAIVFGLLAFVWPGITLGALTIVFGAYALVQGVFVLAAGLSGAGGSRWWALLLEGIAALIVAFFVWTQPVMSAVSLVYFVAIFAIVTGTIEVIAGLQFRDMIENEWLYILGGIASIAFGILIFRNVAAGALAVIWTIGVYAILFGILQLGVSYRMNRVHAAAQTMRATVTSAMK